MKKNTLIIFTRLSEAGKVKTRLIPELGAQMAADVHNEMALHTLDTARQLMDKIYVEIHFTGSHPEEASSMFGGSFPCFEQLEGDLGERLAHSIRGSFSRGAQKAVTVGTDCPFLTARILEEAFDALEESDLVTGPAEDGGYYLIGMKKPLEFLFENIAWGGPDVLRTTLEKACSRGLTHYSTRILRDVDRPFDLSIWEKARAEKISIIIPTLNEEPRIESCLREVSRASNIEIIVSDAASTDKTTQLASDLGAGVIEHDIPMRSAQMNAAAGRARGEILLFLHADTLLPEEWDRKIRECLETPGIAAGAFSLGYDSYPRMARLMEKGAGIRSRLLGMPYGDQGFFTRKETFLLSGGFAELPIMEDYELVTRLKRKGRIAILDDKVKTSPRRIADLGAIRAWLINQAVICGYHLGVRKETLLEFYRHGRLLNKSAGNLNSKKRS